MFSLSTQTTQKEYVQKSHARCLLYGVETSRVFSSRIIENQELYKKLADNRELMIAAEPFMNQIYNFVKGSNFFSILTDKEGCILCMIGDEQILSEAYSLKMIPGAYMDERSIGTNAMGTTLAEQIPVQISGDEHFVKVYHRWTCSASLIKNSKGEVIGSLDLTGYSENVHSHTLGMVVAAANAIERMLEIREYAHELSMTKKYAETIIDSITAGILTCDMNGSVITINQHVAGMFGYTSHEMKRMRIMDLIEGWDRVKSAILTRQSFMEEEVFVNARKNRLQFTLSTYPIHDHDGNVRNIIFVFKEVQKVRKLANKIMGRQAIYTFDKIIGKDEGFLQAMEFAKKIADSRSNILIMGESGTGKELFAQAIHNHSNRSEEPFVALNCGAIPRNLIESELFGYEEGAFTGAKSSGHPGKFEIADGGTIFLDEIGEMPLDMQTRLLRVIEEGTVSRIGGIKETVVNVRVIAATNKDLNEEVKKGNFRKDLFYRLNVLPLRLPPLRERKGDIPLLIEFFMKALTKKMNRRRVVITEPFMQTLMEYEWPGNIRELENLIEWMINTESVPEDFGQARERNEQNYPSFPTERLSMEKAESILTLCDIEKKHILKVLTLHQGNISQSAKSLGIGRNTLYRKMEAYGISCSEFEQCSVSEQL